MGTETKSQAKEATLIGQEAIAKMKELVKHNAICMFTSHVDEAPLPTRPMTTQEVDDEGNFWFFSSKESQKNDEIQDDSRVQLLFANTSKSEYLSVYGRAIVLQDRKKIEEIWSPMVKAWFEQGKDDPNLTLIKVIPQSAYYWEPKHNKMVTFLKMATSAVTGKTSDIGSQGRLKVNV